ncbi:hypothetical protein MMC13_000797 [Lambiella insularis]|nr:hypothetical protein [Lambiella insularis]
MDDPTHTPDVWSLRSRASSIISTGTKTSIGTLAHPHAQAASLPSEPAQAGAIDVLLGGQRNFRITARPGSILSISSFDQPAPPYESLPSPHVHTATPLPSPTPPTKTSTPTPPPHDPEPNSPPSPNPALRPRSSRHAHFASPTPSPPPSPSPPLSPTPSHYTRIVRTIDENHRAELAAVAATHAAALAATRNDIDAAYRIALRAKDAEMVRAQEALYAVNEGLKAEQKAREEEWRGELEKTEREAERRVQRARNEVEELWEGRWRERWRVAGEEMERVRELEGERWVAVLGERWPEMREVWEEVRGVVRGGDGGSVVGGPGRGSEGAGER